ncbi:hypothetical protein [Flavobacterium polysaccharolyticum]|uniref:Uncharacterized protein n=1 Tax=Flavobacterium polysaccharolyticum TaxID=3133148 RepID=A0ABU9NSM4_9FLAO
MKIYLFICLFIPITILSQNAEKIKKADTIYVFFKRDKNQFFEKNNRIELGNLNYNYIFRINETSQSFMTFVHHYRLTPEERRERKSFLKKNKDIIITYDFLTKYNLGEATELIGHKKKVYLIDKEDISWFSIKLLEVKVIGTWKQSIE